MHVPSSSSHRPGRAPKRVRSLDGAEGNSSSQATSQATTADTSTPDAVAAAADDASARSASSRAGGADSTFSAVVKNKLQAGSRIGQACDRCKVRKIRCDALPEGCSHCRILDVHCYVTDRVTGRTERRGYLQELERDKRAMAQHIEALEALLRDHAGIVVQPWAAAPETAQQPAPGELTPPEPSGPWMALGPVKYQVVPGERAAPPLPPPSPPPPADDERLGLLLDGDSQAPGRPVTNYLGVFADRAPLNSVNGTQISILGTLLDIDAGSWADVEPQPSAVYREPTGLYNRSVGSYMRSIMNVNPPPERVELPALADAFEYSEWYFLMVNPFAPVLHKPTYMALLTRIYEDPAFAPSTAELVIVHMVFASIYYQYGIRNREALSRQIHLHDLSNKHYHWALSKHYDLAADASLAAVQAATLIALYTRAFPKPGCGAAAAHFAINKAIDLGLHRRSGSSDQTTAITLDGELRKRAWWTALMLSITLNGRLGRPMPIALDEFDTALPVLIADEYLTAADGVTDATRIGRGDCPFAIALQSWRITPLYMEMFAGVYGARRDARRYAALVRRLEQRCDALDAAVPAELDLARCKPASRVYALYTRAMSLEFRLCLRHPSACLTTDPAVFAYNTQRCAESARALLRHVQQLLALKSLDTTWYQMSVYCAALFSMLAAAWERRFAVHPRDLAQLRADTSTWLSIIAEISLLTGASASGQPFNQRLTRICARTLHSIGQAAAAQTQAQEQASPPPPPSFAAAAAAGGIPSSGSTSGESSSNSNVDTMARQLEAEARVRLQDRMRPTQPMQPMQLMQPMQPMQHQPAYTPAAMDIDMDAAAALSAQFAGGGPAQAVMTTATGAPTPIPPTTTSIVNPWTNWTTAMVGGDCGAMDTSFGGILDAQMAAAAAAAATEAAAAAAQGGGGGGGGLYGPPYDPGAAGQMAGPPAAPGANQEPHAEQWPLLVFTSGVREPGGV